MTNGETDRQANTLRQIDRLAGRQIDRQTGKHTQADRQTGRQIHSGS